MFLKSLIISDKTQVIRELNFRKGINLIVDESERLITGNNVGKTTVLKLIDFCLGGNAKNIYTNTESKTEYTLVKEFLKNEHILITLELIDDFVDTSRSVVIERNFGLKKEAIRRINNVYILEKDFEDELCKNIFPGLDVKKPTFRQIISHNIRYREESINNTLKTLDNYTSDAEYESLHLFMLGLSFSQADQKQLVHAKLKQEELFKARLEKKNNKATYESIIGVINNEIEELKIKKQNLNVDEKFEENLAILNEYKFEISRISLEITKLKMRKDLINESKEQILSSKSKIDFKQLELIYKQAGNLIGPLQRTFEQLVEYHNSMLEEKTKFITEELPRLEQEIKQNEVRLNSLIEKQNTLANEISKSVSMSQMEEIIVQLTDKYKLKGEYESIISQFNEVEQEIRSLNTALTDIDEELFSKKFTHRLRSQIDKFNNYFSTISEYLYGEKYVLTYDIKTDKTGKRIYKFLITSVNPNMSSGKKQGEISAFDIAYTAFADVENIPCLHFLLNDKKELMHDNQLIKLANLSEKLNLQFVASILKDKLPSELDNEDYFIVKISENDKLFRIENSLKYNKSQQHS